jgi:hypothetical protein
MYAALRRFLPWKSCRNGLRLSWRAAGIHRVLLATSLSGRPPGENNLESSEHLRPSGSYAFKGFSTDGRVEKVEIFVCELKPRSGTFWNHLPRNRVERTCSEQILQAPLRLDLKDFARLFAPLTRCPTTFLMSRAVHQSACSSGSVNALQISEVGCA